MVELVLRGGREWRGGEGNATGCENLLRTDEEEDDACQEEETEC